MARKAPLQRYTPVVDSGQVSAFRPAQHVKPQGFIRSITNKFLEKIGYVPSKQTTEQGASGAASPTVYEFQLWSQRYERRQVITDCRQMIQDDSRARKATLKFAREAMRGGVSIRISSQTPPRLAKRAQAIADHVQEMINPKLTSWAWMAVVEGDLFIQAVVRPRGDGEDKEIYALKRMPSAGMERLTDDTDEFVDPHKAFEQVDTVTNTTVATFPLALMHHLRWNHIDGERYGESELIAGRRLQKLLEIEEEAQAIRRMVRAPQRTLWNIGNSENPGTEQDVQNFKETNGFVEGRREIFDPTEAARDFFGNGLVTADIIESDPNVHTIDDLKYMQNIYASACLPTPPPLYNLAAEEINRDILFDLRAEWLKETKELTDKLKELVCWAMDLALLLAGIPPEQVEYSAHFSESSIEKPTEVCTRVALLYESGLISTERAVHVLAEYTDVSDPEHELKLIKQEQKEKAEMEQAREIEKNNLMSRLNNNTSLNGNHRKATEHSTNVTSGKR